MAAFRGAKVTLVAGPTNLEDPLFVDMVKVVTAEDMYEAVTSRSADMDIIIKADTNICYEECRFIMAIVDAAIPRVSDQTEECNHDDER